MTSRQILTANGYNYSHDCKICGGRYEVWLNPAFPKIEVKVKKGDNYTKIYESGKQIAVAGFANLENKLKINELV
jgi:transcription elongation factor Elf1